GIDPLDLDVEELLDRLLDLRLGGVHRDLEDHLAVLGGERRLFGNGRRENHVVVARILRRHVKRASSASRAALVRTSVCRRRMSYTLMPATGRTSMFGMFRAASRKEASISAPSMISALVKPILSKCSRNCLVLPSWIVALSSTMMLPS